MDCLFPLPDPHTGLHHSPNKRECSCIASWFCPIKWRTSLCNFLHVCWIVRVCNNALTNGRQSRPFVWCSRCNETLAATEWSVSEACPAKVKSLRDPAKPDIVWHGIARKTVHGNSLKSAAQQQWMRRCSWIERCPKRTLCVKCVWERKDRRGSTEDERAGLCVRARAYVRVVRVCCCGHMRGSVCVCVCVCVSVRT